MKLKDAIAKRVRDLCYERNITIHGLSIKTGVANSTLADIVKARNESVQVKHIYGICAGLSISLVDFFSADYFDKDSLID